MSPQEWEGTLRSDRYRPRTVTAAIAAAFALAVLDTIDADEAAGSTESRKDLYKRLGGVVGIRSVEKFRRTFLGQRLLALDEFFRALEDVELGPRFLARLGVALAPWGWVLHRDQDLSRGEVSPEGRARLTGMSAWEHQQVIEARVRADVTRLAAFQQRDERDGRRVPGVDWGAIRAALVPQPVPTAPSPSTSMAVRATGLDSLAHTIRQLFRAQPELTSKEVRRLVDEAVDTAQREKGRRGPKIDGAQVDRALHRLKEQGEIASVRRGAYRATDQLRRR